MLYKAINKFKIIIFPVIIILSLFFGVASAYAEESGTGESDILDKVISNAEEAGNADVDGDVDGDSIKDGYDNDGSAFSVAQNLCYGVYDAANFGWRLVRHMLTDDSTYSLSYNNGGQDINSIVRTVVNILKPFAFAFAYLAWLVNVMSSAAKYELMTAKRGFQLLAGLVLIGLWINFSLNVCSALVNINSDMVNAVLTQTKEELSFGYQFKGKVAEKSGIWIIGWFVDLMNAIFNGEFVFYILISLAMAVVAIIVSIKLAMRYLKISCLACVSPLFFGFVVGEETRPYFKNFISEFINTVMETLYMAIVYVIGLNWYNHISGSVSQKMLDSVSAESTFGSGSMPVMIFRGVIIIAIGIMMIKPPRILTDLIRR